MSLRLSFPRARVASRVVHATEDLESWVSLDALLLAKVGFLGTVNLCQCDSLLLQSSGSFFILGGQSFAVTAPRCKDCETEPSEKINHKCRS